MNEVKTILHMGEIPFKDTDFPIEIAGEEFEFESIGKHTVIPVHWRVLVFGKEVDRVEISPQTRESPAEYMVTYEISNVTLKLMCRDVVLLTMDDYQDYQDSDIIRNMVNNIELKRESTS